MKIIIDTGPDSLYLVQDQLCVRVERFGNYETRVEHLPSNMQITRILPRAIVERNIRPITDLKCGHEHLVRVDGKVKDMV